MVVITHGCRDFRVSPDSGRLVSVVGATSVGEVVSQGDRSARLTWPLSGAATHSLVYGLQANPGVPFDERYAAGVTFDGGIALTDAGTLWLEFEFSWCGYLGDGGVDTSHILRRDQGRFELSRRLACQ